MLVRIWMFAITLAALCALCSGCKLVTVRSQAVSGTYISILSDTSASGVNFDRTAEGSIKVSVERYQSTESAAVETANKALDLANKVAK